MKQQIVAGILAVSVVGGAGTAYAVHQIREDDGSPSAKAAATPTPTPTKTADKPTANGSGPASTRGAAKPPATLPTVPLGSLRIIAGSVGPVSVGMSKQAAYATGYFEADVPVPQCDRVDDLVWKPAYRDALDVQTADDGTILSIGVRGAGPRTRSGLGIGSSFESVQDVLGDAQPVEAGYGQTGLFVQDGNGWIGFLFDAAPAAVTGTSPVTFIEVTRGARPGLMRDGC
jgi:hypothetical protein